MPTPYPSTPVLDDFNRAGKAPGGAWAGATSLVELASGRMMPTTSRYSAVVWNGAVLGADQEAHVKFVKLASSSPRQGLLMKVQGQTADSGAIEVRYDGKRRMVFVATHVLGQGWVDRGPGVATKFSDGDVMGARASASGEVVVYRNRVKLGTWSVGSWTFASERGRIGLTLENASSVRFDDFGGGSCVIAPNQPPRAKASANLTSGVAPLTVRFSSVGSSDPDGDPMVCGWSFGDGTGSSVASPAHGYSAGSYRAVLTVADGRGGTTSDTVVVTVGATNAFPATPLLDNFDRNSGPLGGAWVGTTSGAVVSSRWLKPNTSRYVGVVWDRPVWGADQEARVKLAKVAGSSPRQGLLMKVQGQTPDSGAIEVRYDGKRKMVFVATYTRGRGWEDRGAGIAIRFLDGDVMGARALATGEVQVFRNGSPLGTRSVAGWAFATAGGRIGLSLENASSTRFDDFGGGSFRGPAAQRTEGLEAPMNVPQAAPSRPGAPASIELRSGAPNPFSRDVLFAYGLPIDGRVRIVVYDVQGRRVATLADGPERAGWHSVRWDGRIDGASAVAGVYLVRLEAGGLDRVRKVTLAR